MTHRTTLPALGQYQLQLPTFEGPLDVLLSLIERERLEISDLSLVVVTDGFLEYIDAMHEPPPTLLAEFAGIAARLLLLKSRSLLPKQEEREPEPQLDDLAAQLLEYKQIKQAASIFRDREQAGLRTFRRLAPTTSTPPKLILVAPPVATLRRALVRTLARVKPEPEVAALTRVVSIGEMMHRLRHRLARGRRARFRELVGSLERDETIAGFIALLALWRRGEVAVTQDHLFGDIHVEPIRTSVPVLAPVLGGGDAGGDGS